MPRCSRLPHESARRPADSSRRRASPRAGRRIRRIPHFDRRRGVPASAPCRDATMAAGGKLDTRETTVLFAAAIGGADLYAKAGDVAAADALARCMDVLGEASSKAGARVVKRTPDKLMALAADA